MCTETSFTFWSSWAEWPRQTTLTWVHFTHRCRKVCSAFSFFCASETSREQQPVSLCSRWCYPHTYCQQQSIWAQLGHQRAVVGQDKVGQRLPEEARFSCHHIMEWTGYGAFPNRRQKYLRSLTGDQLEDGHCLVLIGLGTMWKVEVAAAMAVTEVVVWRRGEEHQPKGNQTKISRHHECRGWTEK